MQLKFTPHEKYEKETFTVNFQVLDKKRQVNYSPYVYELTIADDVPVGTYLANCSAICELGSYKQTIKISILFRVEK